jgi:hypothetical protein
MSPDRISFNPMRVLLALGDGSIEGDDARVAAALLIQAVPGIEGLTVEEVIDTALRVCSNPSLRAATEQLLAAVEESGAGRVSVDLR